METSFHSIILFISMMVPFATSIISGYRSNTLQVPDKQGQEEWVVGLESAFETFAQRARSPFQMKDPSSERVKKIARIRQQDFVQYLADPYHGDPLDPSCASRRLLVSIIASNTLIALIVATMLFVHWSDQHEDPFLKGMETFWKGLGCVSVALWCHMKSESMWNVGWMLKMGGIARQVRRECVKDCSVMGLEEDFERFEMIHDPKETLEWWIRESWKACEDGYDITQPEVCQPEQNREKLWDVEF